MNVPEATFYAFFSFEGGNDSLELAKCIVPEAHVGLAPDSAFGPGGEKDFSVSISHAQRTS